MSPHAYRAECRRLRELESAREGCLSPQFWLRPRDRSCAAASTPLSTEASERPAWPTQTPRPTPSRVPSSTLQRKCRHEANYQHRAALPLLLLHGAPALLANSARSPSYGSLRRLPTDGRRSSDHHRSLQELQGHRTVERAVLAYSLSRERKRIGEASVRLCAAPLQIERLAKIDQRISDSERVLQCAIVFKALTEPPLRFTKFSAFKRSDAKAHQRRCASANIAARAKAIETFLQVSDRDSGIALGQARQAPARSAPYPCLQRLRDRRRLQSSSSNAPLLLRIRLTAAPLTQGETNSSRHRAGAGDHRKARNASLQ